MSSNGNPVILSGVKPTNVLTLGNYIGALKNWVQLQNKYHCFFTVVDLHAITTPQDPKKLREISYQVLATYIASGIDPKKCTLFLQSHVAEHSELAWALGCISTMGELNRMVQFKDKSTKAGGNIPSGLFTYPVLMAADILLYQTQLVPVGQDQKQHLELTRDLAIRFNNRFKKKIFKIPEPYIPKVGAKIMDLQNPTSKMGKSENEKGTVFLLDSDSEILKKVKRAVTDSGTKITHDESKPGIKNLLTIQSVLCEKTIDEIVTSYQGKQYGHLKMETAEIIVEAIRPIRKKIQTLLNDKGELDRILKMGADKARAKAHSTLKSVYESFGFIPSR